MKTKVSELITGVSFEFTDLHKLSRLDVASALTDQWYIKTGKKRTDKRTAEGLNYFSNSPEAFWTVRRFLEEQKTSDFKDVLTTFFALYPESSNDFKSALVTGLSIAAKKTEGNYINGVFIYNSPEAEQIREAGINGIKKLFNLN